MIRRELLKNTSIMNISTTNDFKNKNEFIKTDSNDLKSELDKFIMR